MDSTDITFDASDVGLDSHRSPTRLDEFVRREYMESADEGPQRIPRS